jgi:alkanesulfonate monooxygenase SsuD/methylene tetrahydromethanopterin reductase-like flavin-dependent oxidoreductase (luciferase family)
MDVGVVLPQGWTGEYAGMDPAAAWARTRDLALEAETLGFESVWLFDHFHTVPEPTEEITFESFTALSALAAITRRVRLGHLVSCAGYRNPALVAKMISTMDVISGGRMELGLGAGWKADEWRAYGYGFPSLRERQQRLDDALQIARKMLSQPVATHEGTTATIDGAINVPAPIQGGVASRVMVGGNGRDVTWRLAARHADELNLDNVPPDELEDAMRVLADRCREEGREPSSLPVSVHIWWESLDAADPVQLMRAYREAGVSRIMALVRAAAHDERALERFRDQASEAGAALASPANGDMSV